MKAPPILVPTVAADAPLRTVLARFRETGFSRLPVEREGDVVGIFAATDFIAAATGSAKPDPATLLREVPVVSDRADALDVLKVLRADRAHLALVYDEFGHFEGIITADDFLGAITGGIEAETADEPAIVQREDGSWLVAGWMPADEFRDALGVKLPGDDFDTVAGLLLAIMQRLPELGDVAMLGDWRFEVIDMDGRRIDKVLVSRSEG